MLNNVFKIRFIGEHDSYKIIVSQDFRRLNNKQQLTEVGQNSYLGWVRFVDENKAEDIWSARFTGLDWDQGKDSLQPPNPEIKYPNAFNIKGEVQ